MMEFLGFIVIWICAMVSLTIVGGAIIDAYFRRKKKFLQDMGSEVSAIAELMNQQSSKRSVM